MLRHPFLFRAYTGFGATGLPMILPNQIFSLNFFQSCTLFTYCTAEHLINATWVTLPIFLQDYYLTMNWEHPIGPSAIALGS